MTSYSPLEAVVRSLHFGEDRRALLRTIPEPAWTALLRLTDEARLTLPLAVRCAEHLPAAVRARVEKNLRDNAARHGYVLAEYGQISRALETRGIDFAVLKGLTHWPFYCDDPAHRPQYDLDLYCPQASIAPAREAIAALGYQPLPAARGQDTDHLPALIRRNDYEWRGDYFDPDLPLLVELHFRFWNPRRETFAVRSSGQFWERRAAGALADADKLSYATWHAVRHLLRGNLRLYHVYEIAHFLERTATRETFWKEWKDVYRATTGIAESIAFRLAIDWFGCRAHPVVREQLIALPSPVNRWFDLFAFSPVTAMERLNKDELFLHLALLPRRRDKFRIAAHRIFPRNPPKVMLEANASSVGAGLSLRRVLFRGEFLTRRLIRHVKALFPVLRGAVRWWGRA